MVIIRSQDKIILTEVTGVGIEGENSNYFIVPTNDDSLILGTYKSSGRCLEVLDEIETQLKVCAGKDEMCKQYRVFHKQVYEMPKE